MSDTSEEEDIEKDEAEYEFTGYSVFNVFILSLAETAKNTGEAFEPFLGRSFEKCLKLLPT